MRFLKYYLLVIIVGYCGFAQAHVGSPDVSYQGKAGNYSILVNILPTDVIPGITKASIFIDNYHGEKVYVQTQYYSIGKGGAVDPELATPVEGAPGWFTGSAWFTISGPADLNITIVGSKGKGSVKIPVMSVDTANRRMPLVLGILLGTLSIILFALMVAAVSASVSDGLAKPGEEMPKNVKRNKFVARFITIVILMAVLAATAWWCRDERGTYLAYLYKPIKGYTSVFKYNDKTVLQLGADSNALKLVHQSLSYVVPDHGKLMHLALVRIKTLDAFAHLHPIRQDSSNFLVNLPPLPPGKYFMYADVVHYNGLEETIIDTVNITASPEIKTTGLNNINIPTSTDDAWLVSAPVIINPNKPAPVCLQGVSFKTEDGSTVTLDYNPAKPIKAGQIMPLSFCVLGPDGKSPTLQPYMGMTGHAIVVKYDGSVYSHLHPIGNFAMASQQVMNRRMDVAGTWNYIPDPKKFRDSIDRLVARIDSMTEQQRDAYLMADMGMDKSANMSGMDMSKESGMSGMDMPAAKNSKCTATVQFPYTFPSAGMYRIWMQVKVKEKILTSFFDLRVTNQ